MTTSSRNRAAGLQIGDTIEALRWEVDGDSWKRGLNLDLIQVWRPAKVLFANKNIIHYQFDDRWHDKAKVKSESWRRVQEANND